jgi:dUTP pyrophosphatase
MPRLRFKKTRPGVKTPKYQTPGSAGLDLQTQEDLFIRPLDSQAFGTGISMEIPDGYVGLVVPRSGLGFKFGVEHRFGVIDSDYRGEIRGKLYNHGDSPRSFRSGDRVAQLLIVPCRQLDLQEVGEGMDLEETTRGSNGFGSTGV